MTRFFTGVTFTEKLMEDDYKKKMDEYKKHTPAFIPGPDLEPVNSKE